MSIVNCGKDERGMYSGGQAGDQSGTECYVRPFYKHPWSCLLRHPNRTIGNMIGDLAIETANNERIGYDQSGRQTFWQALAMNNYHPSAISIDCEADCSSFVSSIVKAAGFRCGEIKLQQFNPYLTTYDMRQALLNVGFEIVNTNLNSESGALKGDIWLNDNQHTAIQATNGVGDVRVEQTTASGVQTTVIPKQIVQTMLTALPLIKPRHENQDIEAVQAVCVLLTYHGLYSGPITTKYNAVLQNAIAKFQAKHGLVADKEIGTKTWQALLMI